MKITLSYLGAAAMFLAACGGGGNAALSRNFAYGSAQTPTSSDQTAASTATTNLSAASSFSSSPSATSGASVVDFAMVLGSLAFGSSGVPVRLPGDVTISSALRSAADRGTLEKGKRADFLVLAGNPLDDIRNTRKLVAIWHGGREVKPRVPPAAGATASAPR